VKWRGPILFHFFAALADDVPYVRNLGQPLIALLPKAHPPFLPLHPHPTPLEIASRLSGSAVPLGGLFSRSLSPVGCVSVRQRQGGIRSVVEVVAITVHPLSYLSTLLSPTHHLLLPAEHCLVAVLMRKAPQLLANHFLDCLYVLNGYTPLTGKFSRNGAEGGTSIAHARVLGHSGKAASGDALAGAQVGCCRHERADLGKENEEGQRVRGRKCHLASCCNARASEGRARGYECLSSPLDLLCMGPARRRFLVFVRVVPEPSAARLRGEGREGQAQGGRKWGRGKHRGADEVRQRCSSTGRESLLAPLISRSVPWCGPDRRVEAGGGGRERRSTTAEPYGERWRRIEMCVCVKQVTEVCRSETIFAWCDLPTCTLLERLHRGFVRGTQPRNSGAR